MRINAISTNYQSKAIHATKKAETQDHHIVSTPFKNFSVISFKGGNKGDVLHVVAECPPYAQAGGVATVAKDYLTLNNISPTEKGKTAMVMPYYNGNVKYNEDGTIPSSVDVHKVPENLPEGHPLKGHEGEPLYIKADLSKANVNDVILSKRDYFLLEEVADKKMSWGMNQSTPIKLFKVVSDAKGNKINDNIFMAYTEPTAYWSRPYGDGSYSSGGSKLSRAWNGDAYAEFDKAVVELMPEINKTIEGFDPSTVVCSDGQAAFVSHHMARKNANGEEFFIGKKPLQIAHNLGDGYIQKTSIRNMLVNLDILNPEELKKITDSSEYRQQLVENGIEGEEKFLMQFLPEITQANKKETVSAMDIATYYAKHDFITNIGPVSEGYANAILENKELAPLLHDSLVELKELGRYHGLSNCLNDPSLDASLPVKIGSYGEEQKVILANGSEYTLKPLEVFEKDKSGDINYVREIKRHNKANLLDRFTSKFDNAKTIVDGKEIANGDIIARAGLPGKDLSLVGRINPEYVNRLNNGEDIKLFVSWGRLDFQKGFDCAIDGFTRFVRQTGNKDSVLILGGPLEGDHVENDKIVSMIENLTKDKMFEGRVVLCKGWAPGNALASASDFAILPSRFMPYELTDLEAKKKFSTPIVPNSQGMGQKNWGANIPEEKALADAYKLKYDFYTPLETLLKDGVLPKENQTELNNLYNKLSKQISLEFKNRTNSEISEKELAKRIEQNSDFQRLLRKTRDALLSSQIADALQIAVNDYNTDTAQTILTNQRNLKTSWETNAQTTGVNKSSAELYRTEFEKNAKTISKDKVIGNKLDISKFISETPQHNPGGQKPKSKTGLIVGLLSAAALAIVGCVYSRNKKSKATLDANSNSNVENNIYEESNLSTIG